MYTSSVCLHDVFGERWLRLAFRGAQDTIGFSHVVDTDLGPLFTLLREYVEYKILLRSSAKWQLTCTKWLQYLKAASNETSVHDARGDLVDSLLSLLPG
jgi:hypothetical protein